MDLALRGKRVLVTGSSSGIGAEIARMLAAEGARVVVHGRDAARAEAVLADILGLGGNAVLALGDLTSEQGAIAVIDAVQDAFGGLVSDSEWTP